MEAVLAELRGLGFRGLGVGSLGFRKRAALNCRSPCRSAELRWVLKPWPSGSGFRVERSSGVSGSGLGVRLELYLP